MSAAAVLHRDPYVWTVRHDFVTRGLAEQLADEFPRDGFRTAGTSAKLFLVRSLVIDGQLPSSVRQLSAAWRGVAEEIVDGDWVGRVGAVVGRDLTGLRIDASLCRYPPGCSLVPHTDRDIRDTTQIVYLNRVWRPEWGGMLRVLGSDDIDDVIAEVLPVLHSCVVMVRSERSWHAVTPVAAGVRHERLSMLLHASLPGSR